MWTWAKATVNAPCPCAVADRFVVVHESASGRWLSAADVIVATPRDTTSDAAAAVADRLGLLPGCVFVFVPLTDSGAVLGGRAGQTMVPRVTLCPVCLYALLAGH